MLNIMIAGVGGQGSVLAAKVLAQAAQSKGWQVRTAETIGMAQRGGNVVSHIRMGNAGEEVYAPLLAEGTADLIVALEPAEGARVVSYLKPDGLLVVASTAIAPVSATLSKAAYSGVETIASLRAVVPNFIAVDDVALCEEAGSRRVLNIVMLASALQDSRGGIDLTIDDLKSAITSCVKPRFVDMNLAAINIACK